MPGHVADSDVCLCLKKSKQFYVYAVCVMVFSNSEGQRCALNCVNMRPMTYSATRAVIFGVNGCITALTDKLTSRNP